MRTLNSLFNIDIDMEDPTATNNLENPSNVESGGRKRPTAQTGGRSNTNDPIQNNQPRPRNSKPRNRQHHVLEGDNQSEPPRHRNPGAAASNSSSSVRRPAGSQPRRKNPTTTTTDPVNSTSQSTVPENKPRNRRSRFGAGLTQPETTDSITPSSSQRKGKASAAAFISSNHEPDDLTSTLIRGLTSAPYHDCPICFSSIRPDHAIWSCSPSIPLISNSGQQQEPSQYCWTSFHVKCIRSWADKSVKEVAEAWRTRGEPDKKGDWRCPGCQAKREIVPSGYWCFCHSMSEPKPLRLATPHSCGKSCSRQRESGCGHPCPLQCHPGPCPPCQITTHPECYCPLKQVLAFRCGIDAGRDLSCGNICRRKLSCGKHSCERVCHSGDCDKCHVNDIARCWCGKKEREIRCGEGEEKECFVVGQPPWMGRFSCDEPCERLFDCGIHKCEKPCHPPSSTPGHCPHSPSNITHCPCGKSTIAPNPSVDSSLYTFSSRTNCTSPIPTCDSVCSKPNPTCSHPCKAKCHIGPCPPCFVPILRPCRCGSSIKSLTCYEAYKPSNSAVSNMEENEILCDRPCAALRACGRHQCRRICCPLASLANIGKKSRRRLVEDGGLGNFEHGGLHECDLVCGKMLSCGNHKCEERDHKGICRPCMRSSFEELVCTCGLTVYDPPIPCGTVMQCLYPCLRPAPPCGHPTTHHNCHTDSVSCPPCPFLATKLCACGKKSVPNVRCSLEVDKVSCGMVCGKLMTCGFHHCERLCHSDDCGNCTAPCGKTRKSCLPDIHPCTRTCHAPSTCPETDSCESLITLTCPCTRIRLSILCGQTISHRSGHVNATPKCSNDCLIAKRNARLADALGISLDGASNSKSGVGTMMYNEELIGFARGNGKFLMLVEKTFAEFVVSEKRTNVLPHMPPDRRKFVHDLASVYRMDTQMIDQEPHRSVQVIRRIDTRIPNPLLSTFIAPAQGQGLGKLADFRAIKGTPSPPSWRSNTATTSTPTGKPSNTTTTTQGSAAAAAAAAAPAQRGWTSVVASGAPSTAATSSASTSVYAPKPILGSTLLGTAGSSSHSRTASPAIITQVPPLIANDEPVPENWEDDV